MQGYLIKFSDDIYYWEYCYLGNDRKYGLNIIAILNKEE